jgi:YcaO-like protein with predicted kinase domain
VPKAFRGGTHRAVAPETTIARVQPFLAVMGITRVANITGLDRIGIPVVAVYRPNSRSVVVSQGKGLDLSAAKASGLMESAETWHAERVNLPLKLGSYLELRYNHRLVDVAGLPRIAGSVFHPRLPLLWIEGFDLLQHEYVWVPYELVHTNYTLPLSTYGGCFLGSSNGLASGNHLLEAISHGICEVVERDAQTLWELLNEDEQQATRIDLSTVDDPACREMLEKFDRAGVAVAVWEATSDIGIPVFSCLIAEQVEDPLHPLHASGGAGCHPLRQVALLRALTEAAQVRLTIISGARESFNREAYGRMRNTDILQDQRMRLHVRDMMRHFHHGPTFEGETFNADVAWELDCLRTAGIERVVVVDLTREDFRLPVVRVIIPGLEALVSLREYSMGTRARARLRGRA